MTDREGAAALAGTSRDRESTESTTDRKHQRGGDAIHPVIVMLLLAADVLIVCGVVLKGYCFARAETRERESLAAYLESETGRPLCRRLRREQLPLVGVLATLLLLLGRYGLLF